MINVVVIEDGPNIAENMKKYIEAYDTSTVRVVAMLSSVEEGLGYFSNHEMPDLIFSDIELNDGLCFEIFENSELCCPIIFTTSYNEYWQKAFKTNSIDYLLKPITKKKIFDSMTFFHELKKYYERDTNNEKLIKFIKDLKVVDDNKVYKERFLLKMGNKYNLVIVNNIKYLYSSDKLSYVVTKDRERYSSYDSLGKLEEELNPKIFFRINRKMIINIDYINKVKPFFKGKLIVVMLGDDEEEYVVSQTRANSFRKWLNI